MTSDTRVCIDDATLPARRATSWVHRVRGHIARPRRPEYALVFEYDDVGERGYHMVGVWFPLELAFVCDGVVGRVQEMAPWVGRARGRADTVLELPADADVDLAVGDAVEVVA